MRQPNIGLELEFAPDGFVPVASCDVAVGIGFTLTPTTGSTDRCIASTMTLSVSAAMSRPMRLLSCCKITSNCSPTARRFDLIES